MSNGGKDTDKAQSGLMWLDNMKGRTLADKIGRAKARFIEKYGQVPTLAHVHEADDSAKDGTEVAGVRVVVSPKYVQPNNIWMV